MEDSCHESTTSPDLSASTSSSLASSSSEPPCPTPPLITTRKRPANSHEQLSKPKRRKPMGRPRNGWTASRRRKLVRLYLMTALDIEELAATLRSDRFKPCKRDIQKQLNSLLQSRPNQIRTKGVITKERLKMLRECKRLRLTERLARKQRPGHVVPSSSGYLQTSEDGSHLFAPLPTNKGTVSARSKLSRLTKSLPNPRPASHAIQAVINSQEKDNLGNLDDDERPLIGSGISSLYQTESIQEASTEDQNDTSESGDHDRDSISIKSTSAKSTSSILSLRSLKNRLQSKYSGSDLGDIKSLLGRLTISRSSEQSTPNASQTTVVNAQSFPRSHLDQTAILPGVFPQYCWEHICHNELARCDDIRLPCNRGPMYQPLGLETHRSIHPNILFRIRTCSLREDDLESMDTFGNTVLHIASSLGAAPSYLTSMVIHGADANKLNNGDQTFLHVINLSNVAILGEFPSLLGALVKRNFNFEQQDHNGQTALHILTQQMTPWKILSSILQAFQYHGIPLPISRDNRGYTVADQLRDQNFKLSWPYQGLASTSPASTSPPTINPSMNSIEYPKIDPELLKSTTPSALQEYAKHASLLKTIIQSFQSPSYEDGSGRNGLHCLFEVRLDLPTTSIELASSSPTTPTTEPLTLLEQYITHLLNLGVNPNQYSKAGYTPLQAFLIHNTNLPTSQTKSILTLLFSHSANPNLRTPTGLTALHLSVSTGNLPATKLLLEHKKANIHARTSTGEGTISYGMKAANKAMHDENLYARIQACVCFVVDEGSVARPTILDEWALGSFRILGGYGGEGGEEEWRDVTEWSGTVMRSLRVSGGESVFGKEKISPVVKILQRVGGLE